MHHGFWGQLGEALLMAAGMFWDVGWSLVLGFTISAVIQAVVSTEQMRRALGRDGVREIALATLAGAASSSCSYASAAIMRTLFKKGAALIPSLAFLFASTNLVIELGIILYLLMGWQFTAAEPVLHELLSPSRVRSSKAARNAATASPSRAVPLSRSPSFQRALPRLVWVSAQ